MATNRPQGVSFENGKCRKYIQVHFSFEVVGRVLEGGNGVCWGAKELKRKLFPGTSGKGGLAPETPKAAWVSQETVKISKTQSIPGKSQAKVELELKL